MKSSGLKSYIKRLKIKVTQFYLSRKHFHILKIVELVLLSKISNFYILG